MKAPPTTVLICGDAKAPRKRGSKPQREIRLVHEKLGSGDHPQNVVIRLPQFVQDVLHLENRILDLLEIAAYVFTGDRRTGRGSNDALVFDAWSCDLHFIIPVRDYTFWNSISVKDALNAALVFLTGHKSYTFAFQKGRATDPIGLFDQPGISLPAKPLTKVSLFSGGLDSLAGAMVLLEEPDAHLCLVSHLSGQTSTQKTQRALLTAMQEKYPGRITPFGFACHLSSDPAADETQRSRSFLYASIAFAVARAHRLDRLFVCENGVTSINFIDRSDMNNGRMSRTTHPKSLSLIARFLSLVAGETFRLETPFLWNTKADIARIICQKRQGELLTSSISCGRTRDRKENSTHCGSCSQCVDRRIAIWAAGLEKDDEARLYSVDFNTDTAPDPLTISTLTDYIRQAKEFRSLTQEAFGLNRLSEISEIVPYLSGLSEDQAVRKLYDLFKRHGNDVWQGLRQIQRAFDDPMQPVSRAILPEMIRTRSYLDDQSDSLTALLAELDALKPGHGDAYRYEKVVERILGELFRGSLNDPLSQVREDGGLRRIDITFSNIARDGFFRQLREHRPNAQFIIFECKNYSSDPAQLEFNQLRACLGDLGKPDVGFIVCRKWDDRPKAIEQCQSKYPTVLMMVLDDEDLHLLASLRRKDLVYEMDTHLNGQLRTVMLKS